MHTHYTDSFTATIIIIMMMMIIIITIIIIIIIIIIYPGKKDRSVSQQRLIDW